MFKDLPNLPKVIHNEITNMYNNYVPSVSSAGHAGSLELGIYCYKIAEKVKPQSIVDLGSGFTSAVLRLYQKNNKNVSVVSVDDDSLWLPKTKSFLQRYKLSTDGLELWENFESQHGTYDLVLYDLGRIVTRIANIDKPFSMLNANGVLILDDAHFSKEFSEKLNIKAPFLGDVISEAILRHGFPSETLYNETVDYFGRFSKVVWRESNDN